MFAKLKKLFTKKDSKKETKKDTNDKKIGSPEQRESIFCFLQNGTCPSCDFLFAFRRARTAHGKPLYQIRALAEFFQIPFAAAHAAALIGAERRDLFPARSYFSKKEKTAIGIVPHQFGYPTKRISYPSREAGQLSSCGRAPSSSSRLASSQQAR